MKRGSPPNNKCSPILDQRLGSFLLTRQSEQHSTPRPRRVFLVRIAMKQHRHRGTQASRRHSGSEEEVLTAAGTWGESWRAGLDLSVEGWTGVGLWGWKMGGENISSKGNSWSTCTRLGSEEWLTLTSINNDGNRVTIRPDRAGTRMQAEEFGLSGLVLKLFEQRSVLEGGRN